MSASRANDPNRPKRAYCKRGTGATAQRKKRSLEKAGQGGLTPIPAKKYTTSRSGTERSARRAFETGSAEYTSGCLAARRAGDLLCVTEDPTKVVMATNVLLVVSCDVDLVVRGPKMHRHPPELDGLVRVLERALEGHITEEPCDDPWNWSRHTSDEEQDIRLAVRCSSPLVMAALTVVRNIANVPVNRSKIANHARLLRLILIFVEPGVLGCTTALIAMDILAMVARYVELGGSFVEPWWSPFCSAHTVDDGVDRLRESFGLGALAPVALRNYRALNGLSGEEPMIKSRLAATMLRSIRTAMAYAAATSAEHFFCLPSGSSFRRWKVQRDCQGGLSIAAARGIGSTTTSNTAPAPPPAGGMVHRRMMAMRCFEVLECLRVGETSNARALAVAPDDVLERCVERLALRTNSASSEVIDSEVRLAAMDALLQLTEVPPIFVEEEEEEDEEPKKKKKKKRSKPPFDPLKHIAVRVARHPALAELIITTLVVTHARFSSQQQLLVGGTLVSPVAAPAPPVGDAGTVRIGPMSRFTPAATSEVTDKYGLLAPPRSLRAETVRIAVALLTNIAAIDPSTRDRLRDLRPLLFSAAASDDSLADLVYNKLA